MLAACRVNLTHMAALVERLVSLHDDWSRLLMRVAAVSVVQTYSLALRQPIGGSLTRRRHLTTVLVLWMVSLLTDLIPLPAGSSFDDQSAWMMTCLTAPSQAFSLGRHIASESLGRGGEMADELRCMSRPCDGRCLATSSSHGRLKACSKQRC